MVASLVAGVAFHLAAAVDLLLVAAVAFLLAAALFFLAVAGPLLVLLLLLFCWADSARFCDSLALR